MTASSSKEKFEAAVKVIRGLPANGPFQPSYDLMLKFYSYYKQATEGKCTLPKPSFWDVVNKKKWEAWNRLGDMEKEKAMALYVDELKKVSNHVKETYYPPQIVETMPQTEEVSVFLQKLDTFYEMVEESSDVTAESTKQDNNNVKADHALSNGNPMKSIMGSDITQEEEGLNHSDNVTLLLKQDMKKAQESSGILVSPGDRRTNGHGSHNGNHIRGGPHINGRGQRGEEEEDDEEEEEETDGDEEEDDEEIEEEFVRVDANQEVSASPISDSVIVKDEGDERDPSRKWNGTTEWSESETENEEFCDTSDEPVNSDHPEISSQILNHIPASSAQPLNAPSLSDPNIPLNSSTPISHTKQQQPLHSSKMVRVNGVIPSSSSSPSPFPNNRHHHHRHNNRTLSDSLEVQTSRVERELQNETVTKPTFASPNNSSLFSIDQDFASPLSSSRESSSFSRGSDRGRVEGGLVGAEVNCRGGEEEEEGKDRRRKGSQTSRGGGSSSRDGMRRGGGSGAGSGGSEGGARPPHHNRGGGGGSRDPPSGGDESRSDLNEQIVVTLLRLQRDMSGVLNRLHSLEALVKEGRREQEERKQMAKKSFWWWPFPDLSVKSAALIFLWPIVLQVVLAYISRRRSRRLLRK